MPGFDPSNLPGPFNGATSSIYGMILVAAAVGRAEEAGCYRIQLTSNRQRTDAHRFYEREGFAATHVGFKRLLGTQRLAD